VKATVKSEWKVRYMCREFTNVGKVRETFELLEKVTARENEFLG
jgi:hypothetical protein